MRYSFILLFFFVLVIYNCNSGQKSSPNPAEKDSLALVESGADSSALKTAPDWFKVIPESDSMYYALATAKSLKANIARDKAIMKAQVELAAILKTGGHPKGADSEEPSSTELDEILKNFSVTKQYQVQDGKLWRVYVMLEMKK